MDLDNAWLIRHRGELFWRPNSNGYTSTILGAGIYREDEATRLASNRPELDKPVALATVLGWVESFQATGSVYERLVGRLTTLEKDLEAAAGDLAVPLPEPGTDVARLLMANRLLRNRVSELEGTLGMAREDGYRSPMEDAIDRCFELVDGSPAWDYPGQLVHLVQSLLGKIEQLEGAK